MSYRYQKSHKDKNHKEIVDALKRYGASVIESDGVGKSVSDLIVATKPTDTIALEIKTPEGKFYVAQLRWLAEWRGYSAFVSSAEEAIKIVRTPQLYALSEKDKLKILKIVMEYENKTKAKNPEIYVKVFEEKFNALKA